jgi:hypothetical protein
MGPRSKPRTSDEHHPIEVEIFALDPMKSDGDVRARVVVTSDVELREARLHVVSPTGAPAIDVEPALLGTLAAGKAVCSDFTLHVPATGRRSLFVFQVQGRGPAGPLARRATFDLLPADPGAPRARAHRERFL